MVGVAGRSKGCRTCRRRKKGCDKSLPSCRQCISAGLVCGGYGRDLVWVNATTEEPDKRRESPAQAPWYIRYAGTDTEPEAKSDVQIVLRDSLARTARELKYLGAFWSAYLPNGRAFSPQASRLSTGGWTSVLGRLYDSEPTLRMAALSMSASVLGGQADDPQLRIKGLQTYSRAIQEMSVALCDPQRATGDGLLAAVRLMEFYEILFGTDAEQYPEASTHVAGWRGHNDGQLALVLSRGPAKLRTGAGHQLFADGRLNTIVGALARRKRSPLSLPEWKTVPWELKEKSSKDKLIDVLVEIPGLLEDLDAIRSCETPQDAAGLRAQLLVDCRRNHQALLDWEQELGDDLYAYDFDVVGLPLPVPKTDNDVALLQSLNLYWSVCLLLYSTMGFVLRGMPAAAAGTPTPSQSPLKPATPFPSTKAQPPPYPSPASSSTSSTTSSPSSTRTPPDSNTSTPQTRPDPRKNPRMYACKIARSVHLFWEPAAGAFGNHVGLFPLGLAMRFLAALEPIEHSEEYLLMRQLFRRPFLGTYVGRFLSNLQRDVPQEKLRNMQGDEGIQARAAKWWREGEQIPVRSATPRE